MNIDELFNARSVVTVGVSEQPTNMGRMVTFNLLSWGYKGDIYAVGRKGGLVADVRILPSILDIPKQVDLAAILVPAAGVPAALEECGKIGVKWAVIMTGGFSEYGEDKKHLEEQIVAVSKRYDMGIIGPNCVGIVNAENRLAATFAPLPLELLRNGPVGILAQSGSVVIETSTLLSRHKVGFSKYVSLGNKLCVNETDMLRYMVQDDPKTKEVALYLEGISDGRGLYEVAKRSSKPIVLYKANIVPGGNAAARSHTAALASDDAVVEATARQANITRARSFEQLLSLAKVFALPPMKGNNVGIVVTSGGSGVVTVDYCHLHGFNVAKVPEAILEGVDSRTKAKAIKRRNPMDLGDSYDRAVTLYAVESFLSLPEIDGLLLCQAHAPLMPMTGPPIDYVINRIGEMAERLHKPVAISFSPIVYPVDALRETLNYPVFTRPEEAVAALAASRDYWKRRSRPVESATWQTVRKSDARDVIESASAAGLKDLNEQAMDVLRAYGIRVQELKPATTADEAAETAKALGFPVVLKVRSPQISHKTDVGGIALGLQSEADVRAAFDRVTASARAARPDAKIEGVSVQKMLRGGREVIVGMRRDPQFGPVVMFGLGGVMVELMKDVSLRLAPLSHADALEMIEDVKSAKLLKGFRGSKPADIASVAETIQRVSQLAIDFPEVLELDINPLLVFEKGCAAVDARMFLR